MKVASRFVLGMIAVCLVLLFVSAIDAALTIAQRIGG